MRIDKVYTRGGDRGETSLIVVYACRGVAIGRGRTVNLLELTRRLGSFLSARREPRGAHVLAERAARAYASCSTSAAELAGGRRRNAREGPRRQRHV